MQRQFYVAKAGKTLGPFEIPEIVRKIHAGELALKDHIYLQDKKDWVVMVEYSAISDLVKSHSSHQLQHTHGGVPQANGSGASGFEATVTNIQQGKKVDADLEWFVLKGEDKFGPFSQIELVGMLQEKTVFEFDYVWNETLIAWKRISELEEFSPAELKKLKRSGAAPQKVDEIFFRRRHARVNYGGSVIVHDNHQVWKGSGLEVSAGGAGLQMNFGDLEPGQTIYLHFQPGDGVPAFNAVCEIVSRREVAGGDKQGRLFRYGVKFQQIGKNARKFIFNFARSKTEAQSKLGKNRSAA